MSEHDLKKQFEEIFRDLLAGENLGAYEKDLSEIFEFVAKRMLGAFRSRNGHYFDGVVGLNALVKTSRQVEFKGEMWVGGDRAQWTEPFQAIVTDKRITKQGVWIVIRVGTDRAEGEMMSILNVKGDTESGETPDGHRV